MLGIYAGRMVLMPELDDGIPERSTRDMAASTEQTPPRRVQTCVRPTKQIIISYIFFLCYHYIINIIYKI